MKLKKYIFVIFLYKFLNGFDRYFLEAVHQFYIF